jgi:rubrerythrin
MKMSGFEEALLILRTAAENERQGYRFFVDAAQITSNPRGSEMFTFLGGEEIKHMKLLAAEIESLQEGKGWIDPNDAMKLKIQLDLTTPFASPKEMDDSGVLFDWQSPADIVKEASSEIEADIGVLKVGMNTERYFYNMYKEALEKIEDPKGKAALEFIMNQENNHYELLQEAHDYLTDKQSWWDEWQKPIFEG